METPAAFRELLATWHDYYLLAGTASATLMGLLFVSLSIHLERVVAEDGAHLEAMAREAFASFLIVLFISLIFLVPSTARHPMALNLMLMGVLRAILSARRIRKAFASTGRSEGFDRRFFLLRFAFSLIASALLLLAGVALARPMPAEAGLAAIMVAVVFLLADAARSAYELLVRTARAKHAR